MKRKLTTTFLVGLFILSTFALGALAAEDTISGTLVTSLQSVVAECTATVTGILPVACGLLGLVVAATFGIKFFKRITGHS